MTRDESYIARRSDAAFVKIVDLEDPRDPAISIMATYGTQTRRHYVHQEPLPLRPRWAERAIAHFLSEKERA